MQVVGAFQVHTFNLMVLSLRTLILGLGKDAGSATKCLNDT